MAESQETVISDSENEERRNEKQAESIFDLLPSEVTDIPYLTIGSEVLRSIPKGRKWLVYTLEEDFESLNKYWIALRNLFERGVLCGMQASTAMNPEQELVLKCYTEDWKDVKTVKFAADEIRKAVDHEYVIYYKTNEASVGGKYFKYGDMYISPYMHTCNSSMYERYSLKRWKLMVV